MCKDLNDTVAREPYLSTLRLAAPRRLAAARRLTSARGLASTSPRRLASARRLACARGVSAHLGALWGVGDRVERYGSRATVSFESLHIRIPLKFCQNKAKLSQIFRNSENFRTSQHFLECSAKFRKKSSKSVDNSMKIVEK